MPIKKYPYEQRHIDRIKHTLNVAAEKGQPLSYEVYVDDLLVVPKTTDPKEFEVYEDEVNGETKSIMVKIFLSQASRRNTNHIFYLKDEPVTENIEDREDEEQEEKSVPQAVMALSGTEIDQRINERLKSARSEWEMELLRKRTHD